MRQYGSGVFLQHLNLTPKVDDPIELLCDNIAAIQFTKNPKFHRKTKHIKRRYHFVRDAIKTKEIVIKYISTNKMIANSLTKPIPKDAFKSHMLSLEAVSYTHLTLPTKRIV